MNDNRTKADYDLLVIGGGVNGTGIARDAAGRGYSVMLCEMNDLASQQTERVKEMAAQWDAWAKRVGVMPWPLSGGEEKKGKGKKKAQ